MEERHLISSSMKWKEILEIKSGKNQKDVVDINGRYPIYGSGGIIGYSKEYLCPAGTTIIGRKGTINSPLYVNEPFWNVDTAFGLIPSQQLVSKYLYYFCCYFNFKALDKSTTIPSLAKRDLENVEMPVPPLDEQTCIVARIEELFSELDKAVDTLNTSKEQLAVYRQAVLKDFFDSISGQTGRIKDVCKDIKVGIVIKPTQYYVSENGVRAFRNSNVRRGYIDDTEWVTISKDGHELNLRSEVHTNDVLISRSGANLGMAAVVPEQYNGYNAIDVVIAVPDTAKIIPEFLAQYTNSPMGRAIVKKNERGAAQGHLNVSAYANLPICVPELKEQEHLVNQIAERLSVCDSIEKTVGAALAQADAIRQSILKQAFEEGIV